MKPFDNSEFEAEVKEKWGGTDEYKEHTEKTKTYSKETWQSANAALECIFEEFASCMKCGAEPETAEAQTLVGKLQQHITEHYYTCTNQTLAGLGQMYVADERFRENIDRHADGTAEYVSKAIARYCS